MKHYGTSQADVSKCGGWGLVSRYRRKWYLFYHVYPRPEGLKIEYKYSTGMSYWWSTVFEPYVTRLVPVPVPVLSFHAHTGKPNIPVHTLDIIFIYRDSGRHTGSRPIEPV